MLMVPPAVDIVALEFAGTMMVRSVLAPAELTVMPELPVVETEDSAPIVSDEVLIVRLPVLTV